MCDILDNFDLTSLDDTTLSAVITSAANLMKRAEALQRKKKSTPPPPLSHQVQPGADYTENVLEPGLLENLKKDLAQLDYLSTGVNQPGVCLFGEHCYVYSKVTTKLKPIPFDEAPSIAKTLEVINKNMGKHFNSVLVNRYCNKNSKLGWHRDDEPEIDQTEAIASLSIGAQRRLLIADSRDDADRGICSSITQLAENSVFIMGAGFQDVHLHKVACGRKNKAERGVRYSLTFRRLLPDPVNPLPKPTTADEAPPLLSVTTAVKDNGHHNCYQAIVIGSSLTKGLDEALLSKRGKCFKVICHPGAHVKTIINSFEKIIRDKTLCCNCVQDIFVVCGGNDIQNGSMKSLYGIMDSITTLLCIISDNFLNAMINMFSLIPRRVNDAQHLERIFLYNKDIMLECQMYDNCRFIDIFTNFLVHKKALYGSIHLNDKLYRNDMIHFSNTGNSVLAKVIIGVTYNPY